MQEQLEDQRQARLDDFMGKVNERLDLSDDQETQIRSIMQDFLLNQEEQMEARRAQFAGQNTQGSQRGSRPEITDEDREQMMEMMQERGPSEE